MRLVLGTMALAMLGAGCAKGPSGGPGTVQSANRLAVTLRLAQPVNPAYFYSFAFDDDDNSATGPSAIISSSTITNGIVGGAFTVLVEYRGGQFSVYRRTFANGAETLVRAANPFVQPPSVATGQTVSFELNLDAILPDGSRLFRGPNGSLPQRLDMNFVTSNERRRDPNDLRLKAYDAFGPGTSRYASLSITSTRSYNNDTSGVREPSNDVITDDTSNAINLAQLDITDFSIDITRSR